MSLSTAAVLKAWIHWEICSPFVPEFQLTLKLTLKVLTSGLEKPVVNLLLVNPNHGKTGFVCYHCYHLEMPLMTTTELLFEF